MSALTSTYRLQLHAGFRLADARALLDYLDDLGASHLYLSPLLRAREGSLHGYDVVDPTAIDPARGSEDDLRALAGDAHGRGMGIVLDIVPNHLAASEQSPSWRDMLRRGDGSPYARWFDVDRAAAGGRVVLPILGASLDAVIERGELSVGEEHGEPVLRYHERTFPLAPGTHGASDVRAILEQQHYELVFWREGGRRLNYRRFFDIDELAGVRVEDPEVFDATHAKVLAWVRDGLVDGLRVDHVDGLRFPRAYLVRLREALDEARPSGERATLHVEKILAADEHLPAAWPVEGTTGYDALASVEDVLVDPSGLAAIESTYRAITRRSVDVAELVRSGKREALTQGLEAQLRRVSNAAARAATADADAPAAAHDLRTLRAALVESIAYLGVYRTYLEEDLVASKEDAERIRGALAGAREHTAGGPVRDVLQWLEHVLLGPREAVGEADRELVLRWQQLCGSATAKGVEDTAFYRYVPLVSRNEVGAEPELALDDALERFRRGNAERLARWPRSLTAGSTHDTKRSADLRSRLDGLTHDPERWAAALERWERLARPFETGEGDAHLPDPGTRYLFFQTLLGIWPLGETEAVPPADELAALRERVVEAMIKSAREAKERTSWTDPNESFEDALRAYVGAALDPVRAVELLADVAAAAQPFARTGLVVGLARLVLQLTVPGVPDVYQGDELWRLRLVDPDNRGDVDFARRRALAAELPRPESLAPDAAADLAAHAEDGRVKLHVVRTLLRDRRAHPRLWLEGAYEPLAVRGPLAERVVAFRRGEGAASRCVVALRRAPRPDERDAWAATEIELPPDVRGPLRCLLAAHELDASAGRVPAECTLAALPAAVLAPRRA